MNNKAIGLYWVIANAVGLSIGMTISLTASLARPSDALTYAAWAASGICVAIAQMVGLPFARSHPARWLLAGAVAPSIGIPIGIGLGLVVIMALPYWVAGPDAIVPRPVLEVLIGALPGGIAGLSAGFVLGAFQAPAIPPGARHRTKWVLANSGAWLAAGGLFGALLLLSGSSFPLSPATITEWFVWLLSILAFGAIAGALAGAITLSPLSKLGFFQPSDPAAREKDAA